MRRIEGQWFDGKRAAAQACVMQVSDAGRVELDPPLSPACPVASLTVSPRLGDTPRYITLPDGSLFESADNRQLDLLLAQQPGAAPAHDRLQQQVHRLESSWPAVLASLVALVLVIGLFAVYGAPFAAREIAMRLPASASAYVGRDSLAWLDRVGMLPSQLPPARQQQLQEVFAGLLPVARNGLEYRLLFRAGGRQVGPNAFALPDATIVMTDELVLLAEDDGQLALVLLHEIGHVQHRHLLRQLLQHAGLAAMLAAITGDISGAGDLVVALPGVLMQAQYSQAMELEADRYARQQLHRHGLSPQGFARILQRIEAAQPEGPDWHYLSSHPATAERIRQFESP